MNNNEPANRMSPSTLEIDRHIPIIYVKCSQPRDDIGSSSSTQRDDSKNMAYTHTSIIL